MTAEIAILNKTAIALAADSAVTISVGADQQKVFDSEDKLFELSRSDAIGVMINSDMHFLDAPLPVLIKRYRTSCPRFEKVSDAAQSFLSYLHEFAQSSSPEVRRRSVEGALTPVLVLLQRRADRTFQQRLFGPGADPEDMMNAANLRDVVLLEEALALSRLINTFPETIAIGEFVEDPALADTINGVIDQNWPGIGANLRAVLYSLAESVLGRRVLASVHTGIVFAGFGSSEIFPTLVSFEMFGCVNGQLRVYQTNEVDIRRSGIRAKVIPFAQKEMVERFLYGLDDQIQHEITDFVKSALPRIRERTMEGLVMSEDDREAMVTDIQEAEQAVLEGLQVEAFEALREQSRREIEDMVEFMPKSELARMAEALVNLTSIKRRVSRGVETVGGPIDCAVISQGDGFVWVKRKHYFPSELNNRYFDRMREQNSKKEA